LIPFGDQFLKNKISFLIRNCLDILLYFELLFSLIVDMMPLKNSSFNWFSLIVSIFIAPKFISSVSTVSKIFFDCNMSTGYRDKQSATWLQKPGRCFISMLCSKGLFRLNVVFSVVWGFSFRREYNKTVLKI